MSENAAAKNTKQNPSKITVLPNGNKVVSLIHGLEIAGNTQREIELREPNLGDMIQAETISSATNVVGYRAAIMESCIVRAGDYTEIITVAMLKRLNVKDYYRLVDALREWETEGED